MEAAGEGPAAESAVLRRDVAAPAPVVDRVVPAGRIDADHDPGAVAPGGAGAVVDAVGGFTEHESVAHAIGDLGDSAIAVLAEHVAACPVGFPAVAVGVFPL